MEEEWNISRRWRSFELRRLQQRGPSNKFRFRNFAKAKVVARKSCHSRCSLGILRILLHSSPFYSFPPLPFRQHHGVNWKIIKLIGACSLRQVTVCYRRNFVNVSELRGREEARTKWRNGRETGKVDQNSMVRNSLMTLAHGRLLHWRFARKHEEHLTDIMRISFTRDSLRKNPFYGPKRFS